jgi:CopG family transcriptional regulator, nickel-responsive regulator
MSELVRFGVSLDKELLQRFDALIREKKYTNRSEAIRDLIRQEMISREWRQEDREVAGAITFLYDHHQRTLLNQITDIQHDFQDVIISTQHIHLAHSTCLEILAMKGRASIIQSLSDRLRSLKGVRHGTLSMTGTGRDMT